MLDLHTSQALTPCDLSHHHLCTLPFAAADLFDHTQKAVVRTPFISAAHPLPAKYSPMPLGVAKVIAGLSHGGLWGALKMAFAK